MTDAIQLLKAKNQCLRKFLDLSKVFLAQAQADDFKHLDSFQSKRDSLIRALDFFDKKFEEDLKLKSAFSQSSIFKLAAKGLLEEKQEIIQKIIKIDNDVFEQIKTERNKTRLEIVKSNESKKGIAKFKSTWVGKSGDEIDKKL